MRETDRDSLLKLSGISKSFGAVAALRGAELELRRGEVHGLVGENGAGKSTLVKILAGVHAPDEGTVELNGTLVDFRSPAAAIASGIAVIYQEPTLFPDLSVAENIFMGRQPRTSGGRIDRAAIRSQTSAVFARLGVALDPDRPARGLSIADQQLVEIAKALSLEARVLVMDEPTAALSGVEVERLFAVVRGLVAEGVAVLFISHRFEEIFALCHRVTVMRDGAWVATSLVSDVEVDGLVRQMVGRPLDALFPKQVVEPGDVVLEVEGIGNPGVFSDISFSVRSGEIVALAGLVGAGRSEVVRAIFGVDGRETGHVKVTGRELAAGSPRGAMAAGVGLVPEDRRQQGLVLGMSIERNLTQTRMRSLSRFGFLLGGGERTLARDWASRLRTKYERLSDPAGSLSGGNQQKVVLAKWLATDPTLLIVDEPTRGIDVGAKAEVHRLLSDLAARGVAVLMVSSELPEVLGMADRVLVMREGALVAELARDEADEESVMFAATGQERVA